MVVPKIRAFSCGLMMVCWKVLGFVSFVDTLQCIITAQKTSLSSSSKLYSRNSDKHAVCFLIWYSPQHIHQQLGWVNNKLKLQTKGYDPLQNNKYNVNMKTCFKNKLPATKIKSF